MCRTRLEDQFEQCFDARFACGSARPTSSLNAGRSGFPKGDQSGSSCDLFGQGVRRGWAGEHDHVRLWRIGGPGIRLARVNAEGLCFDSGSGQVVFQGREAAITHRQTNGFGSVFTLKHQEPLRETGRVSFWRDQSNLATGVTDGGDRGTSEGTKTMRCKICTQRLERLDGGHT
jgi:hypothetical protein